MVSAQILAAAAGSRSNCCNRQGPRWNCCQGRMVSASRVCHWTDWTTEADDGDGAVVDGDGEEFVAASQSSGLGVRLGGDGAAGQDPGSAAEGVKPVVEKQVFLQSPNLRMLPHLQLHSVQISSYFTLDFALKTGYVDHLRPLSGTFIHS